MTTPYLTDAEVAAITKPLQQGAARCRYFRKLGIKVDPRPDGQPLVGRAEFEAARMAKERAQAAPPGANVVVPDFSELRRLQDSRRGRRAA